MLTKDKQVIVRFFHSRVPVQNVTVLTPKGRRLEPSKAKGRCPDYLYLPYSPSLGKFHAVTTGLQESEVWARGGETNCNIVLLSENFDDDELVIGSARAVCSLSQNFDYSEGRRISLNRAIDNAVLTNWLDKILGSGLKKVFREVDGEPVKDGEVDILVFYE